MRPWLDAEGDTFYFHSLISVYGMLECKYVKKENLKQSVFEMTYSISSVGLYEY
jgi:hypothetical protein